MKKIARGLILILLLTVLISPARGEGVPLSVDPTGRTEGFSAVLYDNRNGLPTADANAIAETGEGFIWIGSYAGLIRYDGNTFERMDSTNGITSVTSLFVDSRDRLWIGTNANGFAVMERGEYRIWDRHDGLKSSSIRAFAEDGGGAIYVSTTSGIAMVDADMNMTMLSAPELESAYIRDLRLGADGLIYGLTQPGDLFTLRDGALETWLSRKDCRVQDVVGILPDPKQPGDLYLGTSGSEVYRGSFKDSFEAVETTNVAPLAYVERMEFIDGQLWLCADNGIGNIGGDGFHRLDNLPMNNSITHVMTDYEGNLWFTSTRQGVMKVVPNQFSNLYERCGLPEAVVNATCLLGDRLFVATDSGLTVIENGKKLDSLPLTGAATASGVALETTDLLSYLNGVRIRSIVRDSRNRLWIASWQKYGLLCYDHGALTAYTVNDGLFSDRVRVVCERADGAIMVANTGGVCVIEDGKVTETYGAAAGIENREILTVTEGMHGDMILGSDGGGIYVIGSQGTKHIGVDEGLGSEVIMRVKRDPYRDIFWIITTNSIAYMDADYKVTTIHNFPYPNNFDLYENSNGDVWVMSGNGIYVLPAEELLANGELSPVFYNLDSGFSCTATANSYSELTADGDLYISATTGVTHVNIEKPFEDVNDLKAVVPYVEADGKRLYPGEDGAFFIPKNTQKITVYSYVFNYSLTNPQVTAWLDGFEQQRDSIKRSDMVPVEYTNLRGGSYNFVLQLKDAMGRSSKEVSVQIVKEKKLYEETWFLIVLGIAALAALAMGVRFYVRQKTRKLEKKQKETMALVGGITEAFAKVIDMKDKYTNGHSTRVAQYTAMLAKELGYDNDTVEKYYQIALLHDIGKIGVPPEVLNKPGKLTDDEFHTIQSHAFQGYEALKQITIMPELAIGAEFHHERPDGKGYPNHLKGDEIPRVAQIIAVADCFDAMYSNRPYRNRMNFDKVVSIIQEVSGTQLASDVVDAFMRLVAKGEFRAPDDHGGGTTENIDNIHKAQNEGKKEEPADQQK
ncbi:MAG: HD domain-containing protein [Clostridia bacterium]|nr:HD domain-containing protein [Clostridia bacterium]